MTLELIPAEPSGHLAIANRSIASGMCMIASAIAIAMVGCVSGHPVGDSSDHLTGDAGGVAADDATGADEPGATNRPIEGSTDASATSAPPPDAGATVTYGYAPPAQTVHASASTSHVVPPGYIHQTAWKSNAKPDILGVYAYDVGTWKSLVWRWADTMRPDAIQHVTGPGGKPAYRFEVSNGDTSSPGTAGNSPRAELFSVSAAEDRREIVPPRENILRDGDEYWATWAMYLAPDFPTTHTWATLIQRKFQNGVTYDVNWFSLNAHKDTIDFSPPGATKDTYVPISTVTALRGRWTQFTIHERMSSGPDGYFALYMNGQLVGTRSGPTIQAGDINHNFHYGYYRSNQAMPGVGVVYFSPLMISRSASPSAVPVLP